MFGPVPRGILVMMNALGRRRVLVATVVLGCGGDATEPAVDGTEAAPSSTETVGDAGDDGIGSTSGAETGSLDDATSEEDPPPIVPGLRGEYFASYHDRAMVRIDPGLELDWDHDAPTPEVGADRFSVRWSGWLTPPRDGLYTIITESDDGVRVWVDDELVIDAWTPQWVTRNAVQVELAGGVAVPLRVDYFEIDLAASMRLAWSADDLAEEVIPTDVLTTIEAPDDAAGPKPPYWNPVVGFDCPDPGVIHVPDAEEPGFYMVCTGGTFPLRHSRDLVHWRDTDVAILPNGKPAWAHNGFRNWAPEIHRVGGHFVAYFTTVDAGDTLCLGTAHAEEITGPWIEAAGPLLTHPSGVIDATFFEDAGVPYLLYKIDGNAHGQPTPIHVRQLAPDGLSFAPNSTQVQLLVNDPGTWEGGVVEGPWVVRRGDYYYLFYSGNVYDHRYRTGVARATSLVGPYQKHGPPILANNERWVGPGHGSVIEVEGMHYFVHHAWTNAGDGTNDPVHGRHGLVDRIEWGDDDWPRIHDGSPSRSLQPWPGEAW
jgi:GH43 family beta-xylosidase